MPRFYTQYGEGHKGVICEKKFHQAEVHGNCNITEQRPLMVSSSGASLFR